MKKEKISIWVDNLESRTTFFNNFINKIQMMRIAFFDDKDFEYLKYLGDIEVELEYIEEFNEYYPTGNAVDRALEKIGIDPFGAELPCLEKGKCIEFKSSKEFSEYLKKCIDNSEVDENDIEVAIEMFKEHKQPTESNKKFKNLKKKKEFLKVLLDRYVLFIETKDNV